MSLTQPIVDPSPIAGLDFFDDFIGAAYDNQTWTSVGATIASQNSTGGRILVSGSTTWIHIGTNPFTVANNVLVRWRGILTPGSTSAECGIMDNAGAEWICWIANTGNFKCQCGTGAGTTTVDSGVVIDANDHIFEILTATGFVQFFIDGQYITTITTNISALTLSPYLWLAGTGTANMDYVLVQGDRG